MRRRTSGFALAGSVAAGAALIAYDAIARRRREVVTADVDMPVPAEQVIDLIMQVEREPEFIPIISSVRVLERSGDEVTYEVRSATPIPVTVRYRKWRLQDPPRVRWTTLRGTFGFRENGEIAFTDREGGCTAHLYSEHWVRAPIAGRIAAPAATGILQAELEVWLRHLSDELSKKG